MLQNALLFSTKVSEEINISTWMKIQFTTKCQFDLKWDSSSIWQHAATKCMIRNIRKIHGKSYQLTRIQTRHHAPSGTCVIFCFCVPLSSPCINLHQPLTIQNAYPEPVLNPWTTAPKRWVGGYATPCLYYKMGCTPPASTKCIGSVFIYP